MQMTSGRRRLARTFTRARWGEYRRLLEHALACRYRVVSLEDWLLGDEHDGRMLVLRHDVDQHPRSVRPMLEVERSLGLNSTWYFRWRTADRRVIENVLGAGGSVGLHYETLTRAVLRDGGEATAERIDACRRELVAEIVAFKQLFGPIRSVCPHGDSRVPGVSNQVLLRGADPQSFGVRFDGNDAVRHRRLSVWLTDRSTPDGRWMDGTDPFALLDTGKSPILCLTHPNNFASGAGLWGDRVAARVLARPRAGGARVPSRTGRDDPPSGASDTGPIAEALAEEVRRYYEHSGERLEGRAGLNTLLTNSSFADRRAETLLAVLFGRSDLRSLAGLRVLDVGCGFGAFAVVLASRGAEVKAVDPKAERMVVGEAVARRFDLPVSFERGRMERTEFGVKEFDLVVLNNSLCYVVDPAARAMALRRLAGALRPGGWLVMRNPNRLFPVDQFTGLPLLGLLPPAIADRLAGLLGRRRSHVRLTSTWAARRELTAAGYTDISAASPHGRIIHQLLVPVARYQHVVARSPMEDSHA